jgi:acyl carrier protein
MAVGHDEKDLQTVMEITSRILNRENLLADDNLYEAGLTSLTVLALLAELESAFQLIIPDAEFLDACTPVALAQIIYHLSN